MTRKIFAGFCATLMSLPLWASGSPAVDPAASPDAVSGIRVASGFRATVFAEQFGASRHIAVGADGWVYAALYRPQDGFGGAAMQDRDGDGEADHIVYFAKGSKGTGIGLHGGYLYFGEDQRIVRFALDGGVPADQAEVIVKDFPPQRAHAAKSFTFDADGGLYVNVGVPSNNCMEKTRTKGSPGQMPCAELDLHGAVWTFAADVTGQTFPADGEKYATGLRNAVAIRWNDAAGDLYLVQHGRDQLSQFFPELYSDTDNAELPAEEFHRVRKGDNLGWPYSYYDHRIGARMVSPEYGGDGKTKSDVGKAPELAFPGHWAPNDVLFLSDRAGAGAGAGPEAASAALAHGALIAFHGSWNRAPEVQQGYRVAYVPMDASGAVTGGWTTFADGFPGVDVVKSPRDAKQRPTGLAEGPDGAIYVSSSGQPGNLGRIWKIVRDN